jgi:hypothetical protein
MWNSPFVGVPWVTISTKFGPIEVCPHTLTILHVRGEVTVNGAEHWLRIGPVYWDGARWSAWEPGKDRDREPDFTLLRSSNINKNASLSAYRKVSLELERVLAEWLPERTAAFARWTALSIEDDIAAQETELQLSRRQGTDKMFPDLYDIQVEYLETLLRRLNETRRFATAATPPESLLRESSPR